MVERHTSRRWRLVSRDTSCKTADHGISLRAREAMGRTERARTLDGIHVAGPFAWLMMQLVRPVAHVELLTDPWPPGKGAAEKAEEDAAMILSRQGLHSQERPPDYAGSVCGWMKIGTPFIITQEEVDARGGWQAMENATCCSRSLLPRPIRCYAICPHRRESNLPPTRRGRRRRKSSNGALALCDILVDPVSWCSARSSFQLRHTHSAQGLDQAHPRLPRRRPAILHYVLSRQVALRGCVGGSAPCATCPSRPALQDGELMVSKEENVI